MYFDNKNMNILYQRVIIFK